MEINFPEKEKEILKFWEKNKIFEKLREKIKGKKPWSFLDGPITANNPMGVHHAWGRTLKDIFQRYKAMRGYDLRFHNGFDCQGLWVEVEVEKELGFKSKKDIEAFGIEKFVQKCKERVFKYAKIQTEQSIRLGQWMDWKNSYYTLSEENNYAIWYFLKKVWEKGLLYKGRDVVPWCPRCGTAISQHEILTEEYKEILHKAVYVKFKSQNSKFLKGKSFYFLVWTTTPWTLPANVALAVNPDFEYLLLENEKKERFVLLKEKKEILKKSKIISKFLGKKLANLEYQGIFDELPFVQKAMGKKRHKVILSKEVTLEEGTGIVHIAPGCGQEDFSLSKEFNLPVINPTDDESKYKKGFGKLSFKFVFEDETRDLIFEILKEKNLLFKIENYRHRYPTCWRCKSELIFRLVDEWYIKMDPLREQLIKIAKKIRWIPEFGLEREIDWLKNMKDWLISKKRYWGLALPIFECQKCKNFDVIGSKKELKKRAVEGWEKFEGHSPHRPWIDHIKILCSHCGTIVSRIPDVGNPWLDAGIVPFSTITEDNKSSITEGKYILPSYFRDKKYWQKWFPADLVCESFPGQFKNWFYSLIVMSTVLEKTNPMKVVFGYASLRDEKGEEMHKSKGNVIWLDEALEKIGADVMRLMYAKQNIAQNMKFGYRFAQETKRKIMTLANVVTFWETYCQKPQNFDLKTSHILDRWILSRLQNLIENVTKFLDNFEVDKASKSIENFFIQDLSLWYIRGSRERFQYPKNGKENASKIFWFLLLELSKILAPFLPFLAERIYQLLRTKEMPESVHLLDWPKPKKEFIDKDLERKMEKAREIKSQVLALRTKEKIKIRQPLAKLILQDKSLENEKEILEILKKETNVKEIVFDQNLKEKIFLETKITPELAKEGQKREIIRHFQQMRKNLALTPKDKILISLKGEKEIEMLFNEYQNEILEKVKAKGILGKKEADSEKEIKIDGKKIILKIKILK